MKPDRIPVEGEPIEIEFILPHSETTNIRAKLRGEIVQVYTEYSGVQASAAFDARPMRIAVHLNFYRMIWNEERSIWEYDGTRPPRPGYPRKRRKRA